MSRNRGMTATVIKPAVKRATKKPSSKGTKGNTRKASKPVSKAPQKISSSEAFSFPDMRKVDTSDVAIEIVEHTPKSGPHAGIVTNQLRMKRPDGRYLKISEGLAFALAEVFEANPAAFLQAVEYGRVVPHAY